MAAISLLTGPFWCSVPPLPASESQSCANDLSGTWEGDWVQGNTGGGTQDVGET